MARALLVALAWCAVHGEEYGGGAMPQYGGVDYRVVGDDYRGHARDAPAPLDYKYEEELPGDTEKPPKYVDDAGSWQKSGRRRHLRDDVSEELELQGNDADAEIVSKPKTSQRRARLGSRGRRDKAWREEPVRNDPERDTGHHQPPPRRHANVAAAAGSYSRVRHFGDDVDHYLDSIDYRNDKSNIEDDERIVPLEKTARVIRRKPRDRVYAPLPVMQTTQVINDESLAAVEDVNLNSRMKDISTRTDESDYDWNMDVDGRERPALSRARPVAEIANDIERAKQRRFRLRQPPPEYSDYYDMKKNKIIRTELPSMPRRTTTSSVRLQSPARTTLPPRLRELWTARRAGSLPKNIISFEDVVGPLIDAGGPLEDASGPPDDISGPLDDVSGPPDNDDVPPEEVADSRKQAGGPPEDGVLTPTPDKSATFTTLTPPTFNFTITTTTTATDASTNATVLSMAEKSRLSILKKAQMKERVKGPSTKKPAVLLRVTDRVPTVVLVEPATKADPWMRAREVSGDPPETLDVVKRLMRKKLVASAKNIRELTDNWDDTVCDYIDVGLLEQELRARATTWSAQRVIVVVLCTLLIL